MNIWTNSILKAVGFGVATLFATLVLVAAGLSDNDEVLQVGWFDVSQR